MARTACGSLLDSIEGPRDLRDLTAAQLTQLGAEIRAFLVESVSETGGHLGPNLGVVELTLALHRVFDSPRDVILWDTGHQTYVHKLVTGRRDMSRLRKRGGLSGYPRRTESDHDIIENSHASTALSYADGVARAFRLQGIRDRCVVAVVGDGALSGGMAWEALNNIGGAKDRPLVIVLNDNGRSYAPSVGGLSEYLGVLRGGSALRGPVCQAQDLGQAGPPTASKDRLPTPAAAQTGACDRPGGLFEDLGVRYLGPVDGHAVGDVEQALHAARGVGGPVIVHCVTRKGRGYAVAENDTKDCLHAVAGADVRTSGASTSAPPRTWTDAFADEMVEVGARRRDVVAVTAAMLRPVGLHRFANEYPDRAFDVGIAEQHAVASAAGLAVAGLHPVVALYATFLNRAFDQVLLDVALHRAGVTFVLDRAGVTGDDGPSHNGMWDMSILQVVPGLRLAAPRDASQLRAQLHEALEVSDAPTVLRFPKGTVGSDIPTLECIGGVDVVYRRRGAGDSARLLIVSVGTMAAVCVAAAERLGNEGFSVTVVDPRWVNPVHQALRDLAQAHDVVATVEDNLRTSGVGANLAQSLHDEGIDVPCRNYGLPTAFLATGSREQVLQDAGLTATALERDLRLLIRRRSPRRPAPGRISLAEGSHAKLVRALAGDEATETAVK